MLLKYTPIPTQKLSHKKNHLAKHRWVAVKNPNNNHLTKIFAAIKHHLPTKIFNTAFITTLLWALLLTPQLLVINTQAQNSGFQHYSSIHNLAPKYKANFRNFNYVNTNAPKGGTVTLATTGSFDSFNPFIVKGEVVTGIGLIYNTLFTPSEDESSVSYGLIANGIKTDPKHLWAEFKINPKARWHDGKPITANDVVFTFNNITKKGSPQLKLYYAGVKEVKALKNNIVRFNFKAPNPEMPEILGQLIVLPKHYWESGNKDFSKTTLTPPLGSGPYKISKFSAGKDITYARVKNYWAANLNSMKGRFNFDNIKYIYFLNQTAQREALKSGLVDFYEENTAKEWVNTYNTPAIQQNKLIKTNIKNNLPKGMQGFGFNLRRSKFSDIRVRKAIALAYDFEWANKNFFYNSYLHSTSYFNNSIMASRGKPSQEELQLLKPLAAHIPPQALTTPFSHPSTAGSGLRKNLLAAQKLLQEAGWKVQGNQLKNKKDEVLSIEMVVLNPAFERIVAAYANNLKRLGISMRINILTTAEYINRMNKFDFDMTVVGFGQSNSPGNEQLYFWGSGAAKQEGSRNIMGIQNPAVDELINKIIKAPNRQALINATRALDRVLLASHYVVHNWYGNSWRILYWNRLSKPKVQPSQSIGFFNWWIK